MLVKLCDFVCVFRVRACVYIKYMFIPIFSNAIICSVISSCKP